jgi:isoquinoline 1-oxidoreductase subunit beta
VRVERVWCAVDCGLTVNPNQIVAQVKSSVIFGLSAAYFGEITLKEGRVQQGNFDTYPVVRMYQAPRIDVAIIDSTQPAGGMGEPATAPTAPALANALFAGTGKRLRALPLVRHGFEVA